MHALSQCDTKLASAFHLSKCFVRTLEALEYAVNEPMERDLLLC